MSWAGISNQTIKFLKLIKKNSQIPHNDLDVLEQFCFPFQPITLTLYVFLILLKWSIHVKMIIFQVDGANKYFYSPKTLS